MGAEGRGALLIVEGEPCAGRTDFVRGAPGGAVALGCRVRYAAADALGAELPLRAALDCLPTRGPGPGGRRRAAAGGRGCGAAGRCAAGRHGPADDPGRAVVRAAAAAAGGGAARCSAPDPLLKRRRG
ncbi:hypothetical protein OG365_30020 [Streptomyces sp. NBC_00853]|uniref:hypothetical protein n=1 Tax=Streptomyces sp. NBC_00853 TaxID=2903681 RepID=UPI003872F862|nr:hypothetical protein OG365_30020 [Streptomyces sp. NBC_00853]